MTARAWSWAVSGLFLFVLLARWHVDSQRAWYEMCVHAGAGLLFAAFLFFHVNRWAGLLLLLGVVSHIYPHYTIESYVALDRLMIGLGLYALIVKCCQAYAVVNVLAIGSLLMSVAVILQWCGLDVYSLASGGFVTVTATGGEGLMSNRNESAAFLAITAPALFRGRWWYLVPVLVAGLYCVGGFGGFAGFGAGVLVFVVLSFPWWCGLVCFVALAAGLVIVNQYVDTAGWHNRLVSAWIPAIKIWKKYWMWTGCGLGNWKNEIPYLYRQGVFVEGFTRLHNSFVQGLVEMGPAFLAVVAGYGVQVLRNCRQAVIPTSAIAAIAVMANVNTIERMNAINMFTMVLWLAVFQLQIQPGYQYDNHI